VTRGHDERHRNKRAHHTDHLQPVQAHFGALGVYPRMVLHQILAGISPAQGTTLKRFYELKGTGLDIPFPATTNQQGQQTTTLVTLKRRNGEKEMLR